MDSKKLKRLTECITIVITIVVGALLSIYVGGAAGAGSKAPFMIIGAIVAMGIAMMMQSRIWLLIPLSWGMTGQLVGLPGSFPLRDVIIIYVFMIFLGLRALKLVRTKAAYNWLDYLLFLNLAYLATTYLRNPVGTESMGLNLIGGKPYFEAVFATMGFWVISHVQIPSKFAWKFPLIVMAGALFTSAISFITFCIPSTVPIVARIYTGIDTSSYAETMSSGGTDYIQRPAFFADLGKGILLTLYSWFSPFSTLNPFHIFRFALTVLSVLAILKSGFRSSLMGAAGFFFVACYFRHGFSSIFRAALTIVPVLGLIIALQGTVINMPPAMQRTLSFLPAKWDQSVIENAQDSNDWRLEIWQNVWSSGHKYINNWWFGDGFGMTRTQLKEAGQYAQEAQENLTVAGDYHSLPLSAIHTVGYVGFVIFLVLYFAIAWESSLLISACKGTPFFAIALFIGIPLIFAPLPTLILTGFFKYEFVNSIMSVAMLRLIRRSLETYLQNQAAAKHPAHKELFGADPFAPKIITRHQS